MGRGGAVNRNEGLHSVWRGKLMRRTKGYTKNVAMLVYSLVWYAGAGTAKSIPPYANNTLPRMDGDVSLRGKDRPSGAAPNVQAVGYDR